MTLPYKKKKNSLNIRLAESAVFLRTDHSHSARNNLISNAFSGNGMLRGLLVLDLAKPTRITSIEVELTALTTTSCPEGFGARRIEVTEQHQVFHVSNTFFRASDHITGHSSSAVQKRSASIGPGISYRRHQVHGPLDTEDSEDDSFEDNRSHRSISIANRSIGARRETPSQLGTRSSTPHRGPSTDRGQPRSTSRARSVAPIPPYSVLPPPDARHLYPVSPNSNFSSSALMRTSSLTGTIFEDEPESSASDAQINPSSSRGTVESPGPSRTGSRPPDNSPSYEHLGDQHRASSTATRNKRFSFSSVSNMFLDAVNSASYGKSLFSPVRGIENDRRRDDSVGRRSSTGERGRAREREERESIHSSAVEIEEGNDHSTRDAEKEKPSIISKMLGDKEEFSKEFKEGTYNYPISFTIPSSAPPTLQTDCGSVAWRLKATVHRPGTFSSKLTAEREVVVVSCPTEEETEDSENIIVERNWDQQLQYLISVSGRAFFIGGTMPISFVLMPLDKMKVHRISVYIEERIEYFSRFQRPIRADPPVRFCLLSLRHEGKNSPPILPLESSCPDVLRSSPFCKVIDRETRHNPDEMGELAATLMGPGPWRFHRDLKLPSNCSQMKFTNKNLKANVKVSHYLKVVMRLEKAPGSIGTEEAGRLKKPALFDVVVQTPVVIFSCRCNPDWVYLPRYTEVFDDTIQDITPTCPCRAHQKSTSPSPLSSADSLASTGNQIASSSCPSPSCSQAPRYPLVHHHHSDYTESMLQSSSLFERLVSGQESETGEAPPAYGDYGGRSATESLTSVAVREVPLGGRRLRPSVMVSAE